MDCLIPEPEVPARVWFTESVLVRFPVAKKEDITFYTSLLKDIHIYSGSKVDMTVVDYLVKSQMFL